jgi:hypothetical protein
MSEGAAGGLRQPMLGQVFVATLAFDLWSLVLGLRSSNVNRLFSKTKDQRPKTKDQVFLSH